LVAQQLLSAAACKHPFTAEIVSCLHFDVNFSDFKSQMSFIFGLALGSLDGYSKSKTKYFDPITKD
jgi:hypothetical protein